MRKKLIIFSQNKTVVFKQQKPITRKKANTKLLNYFNMSYENASWTTNFEKVFEHAIKKKEEGGLGLSEKAAQNFALNSSREGGVSFYIHRIFNNINYKRIKQFFISLRWGFVDRVDLVHRGAFKSAFVHFRPGSFNTRNPDARKVLDNAILGKEVKIVYDDPWFWKLQISTLVRAAEAPKPPPRPVVHIGDGSVGAVGGGGGGAVGATGGGGGAVEAVEGGGGESKDNAPEKKSLVDNFSGLKRFLAKATGEVEDGELQ